MRVIANHTFVDCTKNNNIHYRIELLSNKDDNTEGIYVINDLNTNIKRECGIWRRTKTEGRNNHYYNSISFKELEQGK